MKEKQFDDLARQALSDYRVPYEEQDWMDFEAQMTTQKAKPAGFWFWKGLEFAIIVAVLGVVVYDLAPKQDTTLPSAVNNTSTAYSLSNPTSNAGHSTTTASHNVAAPLNTTTVATEQTASSNTNANTKASHALVTNKTGLRDKINRQVLQPQNTSGKARKSISAKDGIRPSHLAPEPPNSNKESIEATANRSNETMQPIITDKSTNAVANALSKSGWNVSHSYDATARSEFGELAYLDAVPPPTKIDNDNEKTFKKKPIVSPKSKKKKTKVLPWCAGISFSPDLNLMIPSPNPSMGLSVNTHFTQYLNSRLAIESGLSYTLKRYLNDPISTLSQPADNSYNKIVETKLVSASSLEVPIHIRYDIKSSRSLKVYVLSGATIGMTVSNLYDSEQQFYLNSSLVNTVLNRRVPGTRGLFQDGLFGDNDILTGDLAFGFEHYAGRNCTLFVQPGMRFSLNPLGDNRKHLSTFSLGFGMRWKF